MVPHNPRDEHFDGSAKWNLEPSDNPDRNANLSAGQFQRAMNTTDNWVGPVADDMLRATDKAASLPDDQVVSRYRRSYNNLIQSEPGTPHEDNWAGISNSWHDEAQRRGIGGRNLLVARTSDQAAAHQVWPDPGAWGVVKGRAN